MGKLLFNKSLPELLFVIMLCLFLCACQVQSPTLPALTVEVTTEIIPPVTPSPTPACTPLKPGMSITVHPLLNQVMIIQLKGFKPGEKVDLSGNTAYDGNGQSFEIYDLLIGPDGSASERLGSSTANGAAENHWYIRVTYAGGVACADAYTP